MPASQTYDYIIVGAGSAGCVLATRLSEDPAVKVLLLEAGKPDRHWSLKVPLKFRDLMTVERFNWGYDTEPEPHMDNRSIYLPRGKVVGGSSSINGMMYCRCHPKDYDQWAQLGLRGWSYADVLPYFKRSEDFEGGGDTFHGAGGPLTVSHGDGKSWVHKAYVEAGKAAGYPHTTDHNVQQEGFGPADLTIRNGRRASTSQVFLKPALQRPNLTLVTQAHMTRVLFDKDRATGIEYGRTGGLEIAQAAREVILSGGAYNSPQMLMLSGIGPAEELGRHGIKVVHDSPNVGRNLQDHIHVGVAYTSDTTSDYDTEFRFDRLALGMINWALFRQGYLTTLPVSCLAYIRTRPELERPDIEMLLGRVHPQARIWFPGWRKPVGGYLGCRSTLIRPESRGTVTLRSANPTDKPVILHNHLAAMNDLRSMRDGVRAARDVYAREPLKGKIRNEIWPGRDITSDDDIDAYVRSTATTMFHPTSSCGMGTGPDAVLDGALKVNGVTGLRVVDASAMPFVPGGHTNAPTIMMAEKAADMILGRAAPAPVEV